MAIDNVEEALTHIGADGFNHVLLQPALLIPGGEFDRLKASVAAAKEDLQVTMPKTIWQVKKRTACAPCWKHRASMWNADCRDWARCPLCSSFM